MRLLTPIDPRVAALGQDGLDDFRVKHLREVLFDKSKLF